MPQFWRTFKKRRNRRNAWDFYCRTNNFIQLHFLMNIWESYVYLLMHKCPSLVVHLLQISPFVVSYTVWSTRVKIFMTLTAANISSPLGIASSRESCIIKGIYKELFISQSHTVCKIFIQLKWSQNIMKMKLTEHCWKEEKSITDVVVKWWIYMNFVCSRH